MAKKDQKVQCPKCEEVFKVPIEVAELPADLLTRKDIEEVLKNYQQPKDTESDHKHKTADEFLDCPECRLWWDKTATRYHVVPKEPPKPETKKPAFGSIRRED